MLQAAEKQSFTCDCSFLSVYLIDFPRYFLIFGKKGVFNIPCIFGSKYPTYGKKGRYPSFRKVLLSYSP